MAEKRAAIRNTLRRAFGLQRGLFYNRAMQLLDWLPLRSRCCRCRGTFERFTPCEPGDLRGILARLYGSKYRCEKCNAVFHGKCGQSSLRSAGAGYTFVICPRCGSRFRHAQPPTLPE